VANEPSMYDALQNAQRYVLGFSYGKYEKPYYPDAPAEFNYGLNLKFDEMAIHRLLRDAELPVWGAERAPLMVWWVLDQGEREIINIETAPQIQEIIAKQASLRGVPITFPLLDLQDNASIGARDIWGFFFDSVEKASARYGAKNILMGRSFVRGELAQSKWVLLSQGDIIWGEKTKGELANVLPGAIDFAADALAERYVVSSVFGSGSLTYVTIYGVSNLDQFAEVERFFKQLDIIEQVSLAGIEGDRAVFELALRTDVDRFKKAISSSRRFSQESLLSDDSGTMMNYRLLDLN
ncbi:MAG: DUF2066 domain-containing protein, partial [Gammaproteobacteria bacterium]|nr:DUF2066 domain-containing protein [Gammaproteobacteria bacterium]